MVGNVKVETWATLLPIDVMGVAPLLMIALPKGTLADRSTVVLFTTNAVLMALAVMVRLRAGN